MDELVNQWNLLLPTWARAISRPSTSRFSRRASRPVSASTKPARRAVALGRHPGRQDQELPVRRALDLERRAAQREGCAGAYEACLVGNPIADPEKPLEVLRTVHSFDPCIACAIHVMDEEHTEIVKVKAA